MRNIKNIFNMKLGFNKQEIAILSKLSTPQKIQDFLEKIHINFEEQGETCRSPRRVLRDRKAHCLEGALFATAALWLHGQKPLLLDLTSGRGDDDHVVALFKQHGHWGAISKTNHAVLRYREPVYKTVRELAMSYFHEYFMDDGRKTLRTFSHPLDLRRFASKHWMTSEKDLWYIVHALNKQKHFPMIPHEAIRTLRKADTIERKAGKLVAQQKKSRS